MEESPGRASRVWTLLLVCTLHGALGWFLLTTSRGITGHTQSTHFELLVIPPAQGPLPTVKPQTAAPRSVSPKVRPRAVNPEVDTGSNTQSAAISPPIDWNTELAQAGRAASGLHSKSPVKDFGFPTRAPTIADYPQFDWDYARTHRVEVLAEGGVIIHLNDNCVVVMNPFPFPFCSPFKRKANGELFKHMHDPDEPRDARVP